MKQMISSPRRAAAQGRALVLVNLVAPGPIMEHAHSGGTIISFIKRIVLKKLSD